MPFPVLTPRVNNNDDQVRLLQFFVKPGEHVSTGGLLAEVETDKAVFQVEAEKDGYVLALKGDIGDTIDVGSVLLWMGAAADESVAGDEGPSQASAKSAEPTAKARALLKQFHLTAEMVPARGDRLTTQDIEEYLRTRPAAAATQPVAAPAETTAGPPVPGESVTLTQEERGMLRSVLWHRDEAVPAYLELAYDSAPWTEFARRFAEEHKLLMSPLLPLIAHQLARLGRRSPRLNSVIAGEKRHQYSEINIGFTIQADRILYLAVVRNAADLDRLAFVRAIVDLQRKAMAHKLAPAQLQGATIGFTSMDRWQVTRHVPILPPYVSLMVAHTTDREGRPLLGATYDHRLLTGADAIGVLRGLTTPAGETEL